MKKLPLILILIIAVFLSTAALAQEDQPVAPGSIQKTCFIMQGNPINPKIYADHQGYRIYFCCHDCQGAFQQHPDKYFEAMMEAKFPLEKAPGKK